MFSDILHTLGYIYYIHENVRGTLFGNTTNIPFRFILFPNYVESTPIIKVSVTCIYVYEYKFISSAQYVIPQYIHTYTQ